MTAPNGVARRALQQAGLHVPSEPCLISDPVPAPEDGIPVIRDPATEQPAPVAIPSTETAMRLHVDLLLSMALLGFGFMLGLGSAMVVVWLGGRG